jgi:hypothetical protein
MQEVYVHATRRGTPLLTTPWGTVKSASNRFEAPCLSANAIAELANVPSLRDRWVAIDPRGSVSDDETPLHVALQSGAVVVDADDELDVLCARLKAARRTSLTIVYAGNRS